MPTLTVIIPTYNEETFIEGAIKSALFADEIILIDSYSTDDTVEIAKPYVHKILHRKFDDFSNQKNFALKHATSDWVLFLDADERITHSLQKEILETIARPKHNGYKINFPHFFMNRFLYHESDKVLRLIKRVGATFTGDVHERLQVEGSIGKLKNDMLHYTYRGLLNYIQKREYYAWFQAGQLMEKGKKPTLFLLMFRPAFRFFKSYILKGGIMDGIPGLTVAAVNAYGVFERYVKLMLLRKGMR
ncbi:glycosyltransferase family 2 protein [Aequorivita sp. H23M31]|uniref:Glycosyltransferase family 2 protein n=1 Tax=Aequorivita ciconiae TaxID=2494375 RepID=A0A410G0G8_9FLAO|nr:glycosyltransferase family 2 protein [Aequorivita sp. H23M31]QAA80768.1 glycosyltransferase family 2 protein [Aequorivita sp. H23M31]